MELFIDTADLDEVRRAVALGVISGCTTNPKLAAAAEPGSFKIRVEEILACCPGPLSVEVLAEGVDESAALDPALVYAEDHPDGDAIEAMAAETEAVFEPSFRQVTVEMEASTPTSSEPDATATMKAIRIESVGEASQTGSGAVRIPILLRDEAGRSLAISLSVQIEASETEIGD